MKNKIKVVLIIVFGLLDILFVGAFLILKLNSSMIIKYLYNSDKSKYVNILFGENEVNKVVANSKKFVLNDSDLSVMETISYEDDEFEDEILNSDNNDYKYIKLKVASYNAYLVAIYDPSKIKLIHSKKFNTGNSQETVRRMCDRYDALVCINGGGFVDYGVGSDIPLGYIISDGEILWANDDDYDRKSNIIGFDKNNKLVLTNSTGNEAIKMGIRDALEFGPFLMVDGVEQDIPTSYGGFAGASRVAIAQRKDGVVLFLVTDGVHGNGPTLRDVLETLKQYGAYNIANLDGGASSSLVISGKLINNPRNIYGDTIVGGRTVVSGFGLMP